MQQDRSPRLWLFTSETRGIANPSQGNVFGFERVASSHIEFLRDRLIVASRLGSTKGQGT
jgi:hypothetical protein